MEGSETLFCSLYSHDHAPSKILASPGLASSLFKRLCCTEQSPYLSTECPNVLEVTSSRIKAPFAVERTLSVQLNNCYF